MSNLLCILILIFLTFSSVAIADGSSVEVGNSRAIDNKGRGLRIVSAPPQIKDLIKNNSVLLSTVASFTRPLVVYRLEDSKFCEADKCMTLFFDTTSVGDLSFLFSSFIEKKHMLGTIGSSTSQEACSVIISNICVLKGQ